MSGLNDNLRNPDLFARLVAQAKREREEALFPVDDETLAILRGNNMSVPEDRTGSPPNAPTAAERAGETYTMHTFYGENYVPASEHVALLSALLAAAREENGRLLRYAVHREGCKKIPQTINGVTYGSALLPHECTCGLDAALDLTEQR